MYRQCIAMSGVAIAFALTACDGGSTSAKGASNARAGDIVRSGNMAQTVKAPGCATLIELGQFDGMARLRPGPDQPFDLQYGELVEGAPMDEADLVAVNRHRVNQCTIIQAHAKGLPDHAGKLRGERLRVLLVEGQEDTRDRRLVAAAEKSLCWRQGEPAWRAGTCDGGQ